MREYVQYLMLPVRKVFIYIGNLLVVTVLITGWTLFFLFGLKKCHPEEPSCVCPPSPGPNLKLVIDHDGGADDAMAITMTILFEKYFNGPELVALTTSYGNINQTQAIINSARLLDLCDRSDIPIYVGAHHAFITKMASDHFFGHEGLGDDGYKRAKPVSVESVHAAVGLIDLSKKYEGDLIIMAIGPLTNIALAVTMDSDFLDRLSHLYIGAGHVYSELYPEPEFNAAMDPEAYYIVANNARIDKVTVIPYSQVLTSLNLTKDWRMNELGAINTPIMKAINGFERVNLACPGSNWSLLDPAVAAMILNRGIIKEFKKTYHGIVLCGNQRGINTNNFMSPEPNSRLVYSAFAEKYRNFLIEIYSAELSNKNYHNNRISCCK